MLAAIDESRHRERLGAICHLDSALGLAAAEHFDRKPASRGRGDAKSARGAFAGVPTLAKDLGGPFKGFPTRAGSRLLEDNSADADSQIAERFRHAGLCVFGLTTTPEFGLSLASEPAIGPVSRNPLDPQLSAGGSSGGAAAAVCSGIVSIAHATDAGGSIRVPAACCGLVGLKPSRGAMPSGPSFNNHLGGIASELAVTRSVRDCAAIFDACRGNTMGPLPPLASAPGSSVAFKIGVLTGTGADLPLTDARAAAILDAGRFLEGQGHQLVPVDWSEISALVTMSADVFQTIVAVNLASLCARLGLDVSRAEPLTQKVIEKGSGQSATMLWQALEQLNIASRDTWALFDRIDCLLCPMLSGPPKPIGSFSMLSTDIEDHFAAMTAFAPLATFCNVSGAAAITLPFGKDDDGLPLPVQLIAPMGGDDLLLELAATLERDQRWEHPFAVQGMPQ